MPEEVAWTPERLMAFEQKIKDIYVTGRIRAPVHLRRGGEEQLIEIFRAVKPEDWVFGTYRAHYHALLKGIPEERVLQAILYGDSIHLEWPEYRFYTSAIVAGVLPIATGAALGLKRRGDKGHVWCFVGDMAGLTGTFRECSHYAQNFKLPITYVVECNGYSTNTPTYETWGMGHKHATGRMLSEGVIREGRILRYCYDRPTDFPHIGAGVWVDFNQDQQTPVQERSDVMA